MSDNNQSTPLERRVWCKRALALVVGSVAGLAPGGIGLYCFCDPLWRKAAAGELVRVASLESLSKDGLPRKFSVIADHADAWNKYPQVPVGAVYLRRVGAQQVEAFNVGCPHAGCFVDFDLSQREYRCPCHQSTFTLEGAIKDPRSPAPRGLDSLPVEIRNGDEIWVKYQNFVAGQKEKIPVT